MSERVYTVREHNAVSCLRDFIQKYLVLTPREEKKLEIIKKYYCKKNIKIINFNIPPNIRAINKQLKKDGLKMCNSCGLIKPLKEFFGRWGSCRSCYSVKRKEKRGTK